MRRLWISLSVCVFVAPAISAQEAIFIVRHAEKVDDSRDAVLSSQGHERAKALARLLKDAGIDAIYTSEFLRTRQTAAPIAEALRLEPRTIVAADAGRLIATLRSDHARDRVLVVGHSNSVPQLLKALGHRGSITIADAEYDNLFVVVPRPSGTPTVLRLRY